MKRLSVGGLPTPLFTRDLQKQTRYFQGWMETAILRDAARVYGKGYNSDIAESILRQMGQILREGELPSLNHFKQNSRLLRRYLQSFEDIFLLNKIPCHEKGVGKEVWLVSDGGLAGYIMGTDQGEGASLTLARTFLLNEILSACECLGQRLAPLYYKSARGSPVDLVWNDTLIKISILPKSQMNYDERPLQGAMKALKAKRGILVVARDEAPDEDRGLAIAPLTYWS
jgi:predicted AAA+ superfamily ATPase